MPYDPKAAALRLEIPNLLGCADTNMYKETLSMDTGKETAKKRKLDPGSSPSDIPCTMPLPSTVSILCAFAIL